ncbi:Mu transposase C-terminal domain-containing protein (plasmid) [Roseomonas sp. CCTCC AB2023176]|uniref:Mu transposase C-terminal domain-containing protein n=1 Tax=Roseomonas sp. CCTCC AB2023176 TaxID=3342640 RepID=UPI0035D8417D
MTSVLPRAGGRPVGLRLLGAEVEAVTAGAIEEFYLDRRCPTLADLMREIARRCAERGLVAPSRRAVTLRVRALDRVKVLRRRSGAAHARRKLGLIAGHLTEERPLALVQVDHTLADVMVVAASGRHPLGRPWLTLVIDVATRVVPGFHLSLEPPSALSVALALSHAVLPKEDYLLARGVDLPWPVAGLPERLHFDNAKEFRSAAIRRGMAQYGIEVTHRPPATPHWGGHIERLIGTTMGALRLLPGATGRSVSDRPGDPEATAIMTLDELETWLVHQIVGVYHHTVHSALGTTPLEAWRRATEERPTPAPLPHDPERFYLDFLPFEHRMIQRDGISLFNITYSDGVLSTFLAKARRKFVVRYDPRDMSRVYLRDDDGTYWPIPYSDRRLPAATLWEIKVASKRLHAAGVRHPEQRQIFASIEAQRTIVEGASAEAKRARRERERTSRAIRGATRRVAEPQPVGTTGHEETDVGPILPYSVEEWTI